MVLQGEAVPVERVLREQARGQGDRGDEDAPREAEGQPAAAVKHGRRVGQESPYLPSQGEDTRYLFLGACHILSRPFIIDLPEVLHYLIIYALGEAVRSIRSDVFNLPSLLSIPS